MPNMNVTNTEPGMDKKPEPKAETKAEAEAKETLSLKSLATRVKRIEEKVFGKHTITGFWLVLFLTGTVALGAGIVEHGVNDGASVLSKAGAKVGIPIDSTSCSYAYKIANAERQFC